MSLSGKRNFPLITGHPMEATTLLLKNGSEQILFDELYANAAEMKQWLSHYKLQQPLPKSYDTEIQAAVDEIYVDTFKGHPLFSLRGLMMWGFIVSLLYLTTTGKPLTPMAVAFIIVACVTWFVAIAWQMNYFTLTPTHLIVKNHYLIWKKKAYPISTLQELVFETKPKMPNYLRMITKDYENRLFAAGTLLDKHWYALQAAMEGHSVKVRNE